MDNRKWEADALLTPPAAPLTPSSGYPTNGDPLSAQNATEPGAWWFHAIGEELRAVIVAGGLTPDVNNLNQLLLAIQTILSTGQTFASDFEAQNFSITSKSISPYTLSSAFKGSNQLLSTSGYQKLPGGLILQWGSIPLVSVDSEYTLPITYPNAHLLAIGSDGDSVAVGSAAFTAFSTSKIKASTNGNLQVSYLSIGY